MIKLSESTLALDEKFYSSGIYRVAYHHSQDKHAALRILCAGSLASYLHQFYSKKIKTVIDLGCGDGGLLEKIKHLGWNIQGVDLAIENVKFAREKLGESTILHEDMTKNNYKSDLAIICETLEHLVDPEDIIRRIDCKFLIASVPCNESKERHSLYHLWAWEKGELATWLEGFGFHTIQSIVVNNRTQIVLAVKK